MDRATAATLASYAAAVYSPWPAMQALFPGTVTPCDRDGAQAAIVESGNTVAVVFRGTQVASAWSMAEMFRDVTDNLNLPLRALPGYEASDPGVHSGYWRQFAALGREIEAWLARERAGRPFYLAGHSLGGAVASIAATQWGAELAGCYTFGQPRAGDAIFAAILDQLPVYRFVHAWDAAPSVPFLSFGYRHGGELWRISRLRGRVARGHWSPLDDLPPRLNPIRVLDHRVGEYASKLRGAQL